MWMTVHTPKVHKVSMRWTTRSVKVSTRRGKAGRKGNTADSPTLPLRARLSAPTGKHTKVTQEKLVGWLSKCFLCETDKLSLISGSNGPRRDLKVPSKLYMWSMACVCLHTHTHTISFFPSLHLSFPPSVHLCLCFCLL